jgi:hypothetical protein
VFNAAWNNEELASFELHHPVSKMDIQTALQNEEQLVLVFMPVPDEFAVKLYKLDVLTVELADDSGNPML